MVAIGLWCPPDLGQGFSDRVRAGLQKEVPETVFWSEKHDSIFKNAIWHFPSFLLFFCFGRFLSRWFQEVSSCVQGGLRRSEEAQRSRTVVSKEEEEEEEEEEAGGAGWRLEAVGWRLEAGG